MSKLEELIERLCPDGVEYKELVDCCEILDNKRKPVTKSARVNGVYPYYGANGIQDYVADYIFDGDFVLVGEDGSVVNKDGTPVVTWASGKIWVNNHAHIITGIESVLLRYLYHYLQTVNVSVFIHGNIPKLTGKDFKAIKVPVPPLEVQREIDHILDSYTASNNELKDQLEKELAARQKQYEWYRDMLLTFDDIHAGGTNVEWNALRDIAKISRGVRVVKKDLTTCGQYPVYQNSLAPMGCFDRYNYSANKTYIISAGAAGEIGFCKNDFWAADDCLVVSDEKGVLNKYIYYYLLTQQTFLLGNVRKASIPRLSRTVVENLKIPVPPLSEQQRIVDILDRFDALCNDITSGLPAEIEARKKQYEYYRDKLLTFKELKKEA